MGYTESELGYAAAAIDGEGCVHIRHSSRYNRRSGWNWSVALNVTNSDPRMPVFLRKVFGVGSVSISRDAEANRRLLYEWTVVSRQAVNVLQAVLPHLVIKREQAEIALAFASTMQITRQWVRLDPAIHATRLELKERLKVVRNQRPLLEEVS